MRGRRYNSRAEERKAREAAQAKRVAEDREAYEALLKGARKIPLVHDDACAAWKHTETRTFIISYRADGSQYANILRTAPDGTRFLQCAGFPSWDFYRLEPETYTPTAAEQALINALEEKRKRGY
jgi:hypothetical protein